METGYQIAAKCLGCGYSLRGLESHRCPECGREFSPDDPMTMDGPQRRARLRAERSGSAMAVFWPLLAWIIVTIVILFIPAMLPYRIVNNGLMTFVVWAAIPGGWLARRFVRRAILGSGPDPEAKSEKVAARVMLIICIIAFFLICTDAWSGGYGWGVTVGPIGISHYTAGPPIRYFIGYHGTSWHIAGDWYLYFP